ncbi:MAG: nucleotide exchange factor GrpE [Actinomycetota bacterium]|nr:nucleotide exchange factor GrpE [Actinomycetota bacterium]
MSGEKKKKEKMSKEELAGKINPESSMETEELVEEIELLQKELDEYKKLEDEYMDRIKRLQADYENYRKRTLKEHMEHIKRANKDLIEKLLPVIDNFERALDAGRQTGHQSDQFYEGVLMIYNNLMEVLGKEGLMVISPKGEEFDPQICEAAVTESVEGIEEGVILEVLRKGYKLKDYLIRPAVVKVCK